MSIEVKNISKSFNEFQALDNVSITFPEGQLVALLGPSGSGKTTLLRIIAGLETAHHGSIFFHGKDATDVHTRDRRVGFVFQHYALFRHMTVFENVAFGLQVKPREVRPTDEQIKQRVHELLKLVQLDWLSDRYPSQLSGGQRQRVALARALAVEPNVLLLDEPFGALDAKVRKELRRWLRNLHDEIHVTSIFVTHDVEEALEVADQVVIMNEGKIEQVGTPDEVYEHPVTPFVYNFLGNVTLFHSRMKTPDSAEPKPVVGYTRPHEIEISRAAGSDTMRAQVQHLHAIGPIVRVELRRDDTGELFEAELTRDQYKQLKIVEGENVFARPRILKVFGDYQI